MTRLTRIVRATLLGAATFFTLACGDEGGPDPRAVPRGLRIVAGGSGTDSVTTMRTQALVVEVRDTTGRLLPEVTVRFEVAPAAGGPLAPAAYVCPLAGSQCSSLMVATTTSAGRASAMIMHGARAGTSHVRVVVPEIGALDSATYVTAPGAPVRTALTTRDTTLIVGRSFTAPGTLARYDRFGNLVGTVPATVVSSTANLAPQGATVTAAAIGRGHLLLESTTGRDTLFVSVVPAGRLALAWGSTLVVANYDGSERRDYGGLTAVLQYGLRPTWSRAGDAVLVHTGTSEGRIARVTPATGAVQAMTTAGGGEAQWYPDAVSGAVYFTRESNGTYGLWRMGLDGSAAGPVATVPAYGNYYRPSVSGDGASLAVSVFENGVIGVRTFTLPGGTALSPFVANATAPRWSHDGQWVAFSTPFGGPIRLMRADGSQPRATASSGFGEWFDWTPDNDWLVATRDDRVTLVRVSGGELMPLAWTTGMWQPAVRR